MRLSQIETLIVLLVIAMIVGSSHVEAKLALHNFNNSLRFKCPSRDHSIAVEPSDLSADGVSSVSFEQRLRKLMCDKIGQLSLSSTLDQFTPSTKSNKENSSIILLAKNGGSTDGGGGNGVGHQFFDFWEVNGSIELSIKELIELEPEAKKIISDLDEQIPSVDVKLDAGAFGQTLMQSLGKKTIYLETKSLTSSGCVNRSLVGTQKQVIWACQDDLQVRFNLPLVRDPQVSSFQRAGLIIHELLLAWARGDNYRERNSEEKAIMEEKIRILNQRIFGLSQPNEDLSVLIKNLFGARVLNKKNYLESLQARKYIQDFEVQVVNPIVLNNKKHFSNKNSALSRFIYSQYQGVKEQYDTIHAGIVSGELSRNSPCAYFIQALGDMLKSGMVTAVEALGAKEEDLEPLISLFPLLTLDSSKVCLKEL